MTWMTTALTLLGTRNGRRSYIAVFVPANLFSGPSYEAFMRYFQARFRFLEGFVFDAREFGDVRGAFSVTFTVGD